MSDVHDSPAEPTGDESADAAAMRAELAEAKRIGAWLYDHLPWAVRGQPTALGDPTAWSTTSEVPAAGSTSARVMTRSGALTRAKRS